MHHRSQHAGLADPLEAILADVLTDALLNNVERRSRLPAQSLVENVQTTA